MGVTCGALGLLLGVFTEWRTAPFVTDGSLSFFLAHLHKLSVVTQALILVGAACGYWFGLGREGGAWPRRQNL